MAPIELPICVCDQIMHYVSHPLADIMTPVINDFAGYNEELNRQDPDAARANTFYMFYFMTKKLETLHKLVNNVINETGMPVVVPEEDMRPSLWREYARVYPGYFTEFNRQFLIPSEFADSETED